MNAIYGGDSQKRLNKLTRKRGLNTAAHQKSMQYNVIVLIHAIFLILFKKDNLKNVLRKIRFNIESLGCLIEGFGSHIQGLDYRNESFRCYNGKYHCFIESFWYFIQGFDYNKVKKHYSVQCFDCLNEGFGYYIEVFRYQKEGFLYYIHDHPLRIIGFLLFLAIESF